MKKTGLFLLSIILSTSLLAGCGSKKADTKKDTAQNTAAAEQSQKNSTSSQTSTTSTSSGNKEQTAKSVATPTLDRLLQEEKTVDRAANGGLKTEFVKSHPTETLLDYVNFCGKYEIDKNWPAVDPAEDNDLTKISDTAVIYHLPVVDNDNNVLEKRDMRVEFKEGAWSVISDVVVK